jgi:hypothetical protein
LAVLVFELSDIFLLNSHSQLEPHPQPSRAAGTGSLTWSHDECVDNKLHTMSSGVKQYLTLHYQVLTKKIESTSTKRIHRMTTLNQWLGLRCINHNEETQLIWKNKQLDSSKNHSSIIMDSNDWEVHKTSKKLKEWL